MIGSKPLKRVSGTRKKHDRQARSICRECTVGCALIASVRDEVIVDVQGDEDHPVSRGRLCARGTAFVQGINSPDRIMFPASRRRLAGPFEAADNLDAAFDDLADRLRKIRETHGPASLYIGCDPEAGLDFYLGVMRFARLWGTPHVHHPLDMPPTMAGDGVLNSPARTCADWPNSGTLLLVEADLAATHPVAFGWALEAQRRGARIVAADARFTTTLSKADHPLMIAPGAGNALGLFLLKVMLDESLQDPEAVEAALNAPENWEASFAHLSLADAPSATGLSADDIVGLCRMLKREGPVTVITGKRLAYQDHYRSWPTLAAAMGWMGRPGGGWYPLESGRPRLDAAGDIDEETAGPLPSGAGAYPYQTRKSHAPEEGTIRAVIGSGNCFNDFFLPFADLARKMDLVVHFGAFPNRTRDLSHMIFPATLWAERDGLCFSNDRAIQWGPRIVPPGGARGTGLDFWTRLSARFGWDEHFPWKLETGSADAPAFYDWLLDHTPDTKGLTVGAIRGAEPDLTVWPAAPEKRIQAAPPFFPTESGKIDPQTAPETLSTTPDDPEFPLCYQAARIAPRSGDAGRWRPWIDELEAGDAVQIHPDTAAALCIAEGEDILVAGPGASLTGRAWISRIVPKKTVWAAQRLGVERVLLQRKGQAREAAIECLKAIS
jgi:sulfite reductase (NADPH) flavoprotein alpha-component